jgi:hypothetical protein
VQYLALIHSDEVAWDALDEDVRDGLVAEYMSFATKARAAGVMLDGERLAPSHDATTVRVRDQQTLVVDGPYAEVKEALGGYFVLECGSIDEACEWAAEIPGALYGAIEVRQIHRDPEEGHL